MSTPPAPFARSRRSRLVAAAATLAAGGLLATGLAPAASAQTSQSPRTKQPVRLVKAAAASTGMAVSGNRFLRDGVPFTPVGFNSVGALTPPGCRHRVGLAAAANFTEERLRAMRDRWGANTIRLQVSQSGLDAADPGPYLASIRNKVNLARSLDLVVILSMQDQAIGCGKASPLPSQATIRAWRAVLPTFQSWPYVMFEIFNEPQNDPVSEPSTDPYVWHWPDWRSGGREIKPCTAEAKTAGECTKDFHERWSAYTPVGHQALVRAIRSTGARNVLIADGANYGGRLQGVPLLNDPADNLAYAVHPYYITDGRARWDVRFGNLSATQAVVATEWNYDGDDCGTARQRMAPEFFEYMREKNIGVFGHSFDAHIGRNLMADWDLTPTQCGTAKGGGGRDFMNYLAAVRTG